VTRAYLRSDADPLATDVDAVIGVFASAEGAAAVGVGGVRDELAVGDASDVGLPEPLPAGALLSDGSLAGAAVVMPSAELQPLSIRAATRQHRTQIRRATSPPS
jgi:hypothetical protein